MLGRYTLTFGTRRTSQIEWGEDDDDANDDEAWAGRGGSVSPRTSLDGGARRRARRDMIAAEG
jgi:hypothetical protein